MTARLRRSALGTPGARVAMLVPLLLVAATAVVLVLRGGDKGSRPSTDPSASAGGSAPGGSATTVPAAAIETFDGPRYDPATVRSPTRESGQAKVWTHAGGWWGILLAPDGRPHVFRLDPGGPAWIDTGLAVDDRDDALIDARPAGDSVFLVATGRATDSPGDATWFSELVYDADADRYGLAADTPIRLTTGGARSVTLAADPSGRLWLALIVDERLAVMYTTDDLRTWATLKAAPGSAASVRANQAVVVAQAAGTALAWTSSERQALFVAQRDAGDAPDAWRETIIEGDGIGGVSGHLSALALPGRGGDRLLVTSGSALEQATTNSNLPLVVLVSIEPQGSWEPHLLGRISDHHARPVLAADPAAGRLFALATVPSGDGSAIVAKESPLEAIRFGAGRGAPLLDAGDAGSIDDVTTTGQLMSAGTGLVALASDDARGVYATALVTLGDGSIPGAGWTAPTAPRVLARDTFDPWTPDDAVRLAWAVSRGTPDGRLAFVGAGGDAGTVLRVAKQGAERARACRPFAIPTGPVALDITIRMRGVAASDAAVALRAGGDDTGVIRFDDTGVVAHYDGATKVRSASGFATDTWYRVRLTADPADRTFDATVDRPGGARLLAVSGAAWRTADGSAPIDELCVEAPAGAGAAIEIDQLTVEG